VAKILKHNSDPTQTYKLGINKFADMTPAEFKAFRSYNLQMALTSKAKAVPYTLEASRPLADNVDWRTQGVVTPVKDQGQCGSCWAFATTEAVESALSIATKSAPLILSPQNVVSCTPNPNHCGGTGGCNGATAELGFDYVHAHGIATEQNWPYKAVTGTCNETAHTKVATISGYVKLPENQAQPLLDACATVGPIAISVDASTWSLYRSGIYNGCSTTSLDIDHAVVLVGYGTDSSSHSYWLVRNSWGASWGESGYIRLYRGPNEKCAVDTTPSDGSGCDGGPTKITVCGTCGIWYDNSYPVGATKI